MDRKTNLGRVALLAGLGIGAGLAIGAAIENRKFHHPDHILTSVKDSFRKSGPLAGAWIDQHPTPFVRFGTATVVYRGGVIKQEDGVLTVYNFLADSKTGKVVDVWKEITDVVTK